MRSGRACLIRHSLVISESDSAPLGVSYDEVIKETEANCASRLYEFPSDLKVCLAWAWTPTRVVVRNPECCAPGREHSSENVSDWNQAAIAASICKANSSQHMSGRIADDNYHALGSMPAQQRRGDVREVSRFAHLAWGRR
jgi:hypothetical protein